MRQAKPQATLVGENWTETPKIAAYYGSTAAVREGDELPMSFNFPLAEAIVKAVRDGEASGIAAKLQEMAELYPAGIIDTPFLTNHDQQRVATQLGDDPAKLRQRRGRPAHPAGRPLPLLRRGGRPAERPGKQ